MDEPKDWTTTLLLCLFLGVLGVHRFYTGHVGIGIVQLLTMGGCGIWALVDLIMIATGKFTDSDGRPLDRGDERPRGGNAAGPHKADSR